MLRTSKTKVIVFLSIALSVLVSISILRGSREPSDDDVFRAALSARQFDLAFLEGLAQKEIVPSNGHAISNFYSVSTEHDRIERLENFLVLHERQGIPAVTLYLKENPIGRTYLKIEFPGCEPGFCQSLAKTATFEPSTEEIWESYYWAPNGGRETYHLPKERVKETEYSTSVTMFFDRVGRITGVSINASRDAKSGWEAFKVAISSGGATQVPVYWGQRVLSQTGLPE